MNMENFNGDSGFILSWAIYPVTYMLINQEAEAIRACTWQHPPALICSLLTMSQGFRQIMCVCVCACVCDVDCHPTYSSPWWQTDTVLEMLVHLLFDHLTRLLAWESFTQFWIVFKLKRCSYNMKTACGISATTDVRFNVPFIVLLHATRVKYGNTHKLVTAAVSVCHLIC
jgi:hypothetical protein